MGPDVNSNSSDMDKKLVHDFWDAASCGEGLYLDAADLDGYREQSRKRYILEPYIEEFADFSNCAGLSVLEIGVGLGSDHQRFAEHGAVLSGVDLTSRAVEHTKRRFAATNNSSKLSVGDAENLQFPDRSFDLVYSWGVLHHSPDTMGAISEVWRVLKPGGRAKIMIYNKFSVVGFMLWVRYGLMKFRPGLSLEKIYSNYLESPGTKAYSIKSARDMFSQFNDVSIRTVLTHGDLLESEAGQRHRGILLSVARYVWPRRIIRSLFPKSGLFMLIEARKPSE